MLSRRQTRPVAGRVVRRSDTRAPAPAAAARRRDRSTFERLEDRRLLAADVVISEFMASNNNTLADNYGEYADWIELHNRGDAAQNLDGFFLTDSGADLTMWRLPAVTLPAGGYLTVFASEQDDAAAGAPLHTNFKLDAGGEYLALVRPDGLTVQHAYAPSYPSQDTDVSYGLSFERLAGNFEQQPFTQPTPGAANVANAPAPVFSVRGGTFASNFNLVLSTTLPGATIRYTTNRSLPNAASTAYTGPIPITTSTIVRAQVFAPGRTPSPVVSETYLALDASVQNFNSNLPVVILDTFGAGVAADPQTMVGSVVIDTGPDGRATMLGSPDYAGRAGLNVRGQSSAGFPKQQYHFELWDEADQDTDESLLGMPAESDWVLYAPYSEKTLMQNALAYMWSNRMGQYAVRTRFVEVFMNNSAAGKVDYAGDYRGVYILMEKIKTGDERVDIPKLGPEDNAEPDITGGYIFAKDKPDPGESSFRAAGNDFRFVEPGPTEITYEQANYLTGYLDEFYAALQGPNFKDPNVGYAKYIDVDSFIDQHILTELTKNIDGFRISTYYSKDRNGKVKMGPSWDFNLSLGNANYNGGQYPTGFYSDGLSDYDYPYFRRLFQDPAFVQKYQDRWQELRQDELSTARLMADIDGLTSLLSDGNGNYPVGNSPPQAPNNPVVRNFQRWQNLAQPLWPNYYVDPAWINHVNWTKDWLRQRVEWWDGLYLGAPTITPAGGAVSAPTQVTITAPGAPTNNDVVVLPYGAPAKAFVPTSDIGDAWRNRTYDEAGWTSGTTGVGYDNNGPANGDLAPFIGLNTPMAGVNNSVYIRVPFTVSNPAALQNFFLRMRYDDGFIAYLNGTRVAASLNAPAANDWQSSTNGSTNESTNFEGYNLTAFKNLLVPGTNMLAIQGLNANATSSDALFIPELVNRTTTLQPAPVYYTTDGTDPRMADGSVNPAAVLYSGPFTVTSTARVMARSRAGTRWSGLSSELYDFGENRLRISEIMYNPAPAPAGSPYLPGDFEYVELINTGTQAMNLDRSRFDRGIDADLGSFTLNPGARAVVVKNRAAFESRYGAGKPIAGTFTGSLSDGGERLTLLGRFGEVVHDFSYSDDWYPQTDGQGWSLTIVDPAAPVAAWGTKDGWRASEPVNGTPGTNDSGLRPNSVVINEVMTNGVAGGDWIELRNTTGSPISVANWYLSDTPANLKKWRIPTGAANTIPANGYLVFTEAQFGGAFSFSANGEGVYLSSGMASANELGGYRVDETFGASDAGVTFGRTALSTGGADFTALVSPTQGAANSAPVIGPVVINEIMYHPQGTKPEYIELRNLTASAVSLFDPADPNATWKFAGGIDWAFPANVTIPANGFVIVAAVDPAAFRSQYSVPAGVQVFGPYTLANGTNVLANDGESVRLMRPGAAGPVATRPFVQVDRIAYDDQAPWPLDANGTGQSIARVTSPTAYGNDPANWGTEVVGGSPGKPNLDTTPPTVDVVDVTPDPRSVPVASITLLFSEAVTGVDRSDLRLTRNGSSVTLTNSQTVTSPDGGVTWVVGNLGSLTSSPGTYVLTVVASGSGITDTGGRALAANATDTWVTNASDTAAPSAAITAVTPDPRNTAVNTVTVVFNEAVTGVDRADFTLTRGGGADLLTAAQTIASTDGGVTWTLGGLSALTGADGAYVLALKGSGTGIADLAGNALAAGTSDQWLMDATRPTADVVDVAPDLRASPVGSLTINFSEPVTGLDLADLRLTRDGGANLLTAAQTLVPTNGGATWTLGNLTGLTGAGGSYAVTLVTAGSGVVDAVGNTLSTIDASDTWVVDAAAPTADVIDVSPDPRNGPVDSITITFSEAVTGFDLLDLQLLRTGNPANLLAAAQTLTTTDNVTWTLNNLAAVTGAGGTYTLRLGTAQSGISDAAGNSLQVDATETWTTDASAPTADVVDVTPDPRETPVDAVTITFSESVTGLDLGDLRLAGPGGASNLLTAAQTLTTADGGVTWVLGNLAGITAADGAYTLTVVSAASGVRDAVGNVLGADASDSWVVEATEPTLAVSEIFVRGSSWAGRDDRADTTTFMEYLEAKGLGDDAYGYRVFGVGRAAPAENDDDVLPWINVNQVVVRFVEAPTASAAPAAGTILDGQRGDYTVTTVTPVEGDPRAFVLTLDRPLGGGDGVSVAPAAAQNGDRVVFNVANVALRLNVLQGDVAHSQESTHAVLANDYAEVKNRFFKTTKTATGTAADYTAFHDVDGNGSILANDYAEVKKRFFHSLPAPTAAASAPAGDGATLEGSSMTKDVFASTPILA